MKFHEWLYSKNMVIMNELFEKIPNAATKLLKLEPDDQYMYRATLTKDGAKYLMIHAEDNPMKIVDRIGSEMRGLLASVDGKNNPKVVYLKDLRDQLVQMTGQIGRGDIVIDKAIINLARLENMQLGLNGHLIYNQAGGQWLKERQKKPAFSML